MLFTTFIFVPTCGGKLCFNSLLALVVYLIICVQSTCKAVSTLENK